MDDASSTCLTDCLWSNDGEGVPPSAAKDGHANPRLIEILLRTQGDRLRRRQRRQETLVPSPDGVIDWNTNGDSSFEATPTDPLQRHLAVELVALVRRLCGLSSAKPSSTTDEGGISTDDLYRHLAKYSSYGLGQRTRETEELRKPEKRKRPKTSELDPTFMLMGIGRK